ncbi:hypothetical protein UCYN_07560 [Candidatus Atelocyanobacterium thalassa isolate ALOHA]|uniref:Uncharacterized protein n=1 Tax=Atelocyanobacterium thalassa (isolate ALOHA) TaxID=1453429 RepID=D3EPQ0_ATETH|nr:hypothetical protein UCYN_07560 [Candidatus Atelocyanobacterium thalassa isolate ALOHA]
MTQIREKLDVQENTMYKITKSFIHSIFEKKKSH